MSFKVSLAPVEVQWNRSRKNRWSAKQLNWEHYLMREKTPLGRFWINTVQEKFVILRVPPEKKTHFRIWENVLLLFKLTLQHAIRRVYLCLPFHFLPSLLEHVDEQSETNKQLFSKVFTCSVIPHVLKEIFIFPQYK